MLDIDFHGPDDFLKELGLVKFESHVIEPIRLELVVSQDRSKNPPLHLIMQLPQVVLRLPLDETFPISHFNEVLENGKSKLFDQVLSADFHPEHGLVELE